MASYDYGQLQAVNPAYQQGYTTLPPQSHQSIDPTNQYQMINSYQPPLQQGLPPSQYSSMMMYPPKTDANFLPHIPSPLPMQQINYSMAPNGGTFPLPERFFFRTVVLWHFRCQLHLSRFLDAELEWQCTLSSAAATTANITAADVNCKWREIRTTIDFFWLSILEIIFFLLLCLVQSYISNYFSSSAHS